MRATAASGHRRLRARSRHHIHREPDRLELLAQPLYRRLRGVLATRRNLLERDGRSMAEESLQRADVRRHVDHSRRGHRPHRLSGHHGREPAHVAGQPDVCPRFHGAHGCDPPTRRQDTRHRSPPNRHGRTRLRVARHPAWDRRRIAPRRPARDLLRGPRGSRPARFAPERHGACAGDRRGMGARAGRHDLSGLRGRHPPHRARICSGAGPTS